MALFQDVLITADYDYTLTAPDGSIPERNLEAIRYFTENGGSFTVNTGRSAVTAAELMKKVPANAPFLLMNGSGVYSHGEFIELHPIALEPWSVLCRIAEEFPQVAINVQGTHAHYILDATEEDAAHHAKMGWAFRAVKPGDDVGVFAKFNVQVKQQKALSQALRIQTPEEVILFDRIQARIEELWGEHLVVFRAGPMILNVHAKGVSKIQSARNLQKQLDKKILVCIGDAENDISMLDGADYAFCPADGVVADRYETVCNCADGAVADVIYEKIPEILKNRA